MTLPTTHTRARVASITGPHVDAQAVVKLRTLSGAGAPPPAPARATPLRAGDLAGKLNVELDGAGFAIERETIQPDDGVQGSKADQAKARADKDAARQDKLEASPQYRVNKAAREIEKNLDKAKQVGVDATRKSFWTKVLGATVATLALSVVITLSVATGGAPLAAAVAVAGVVFAVSIADACCAYMNHRNARAFAAGGTPPHRLPMGDSSIGNAIYMGCSAFMSHGTAKTLARCIDNSLRLGLMLTGGICTGGASIATNSFEHIAPLVAASVNVTTLLVNFRSAWGSHATYSRHVKNIEDAYLQLGVLAGKLPAGKAVEMLALIQNSRNDALPEIASMRGAVPKRGEALVRTTLGLGLIISGVVAALMPGSTIAAFRLPTGPQSFVAPTTGGVGGVGTTQVRHPQVEVPHYADAEQAPPPRDEPPTRETQLQNLVDSFKPDLALDMHVNATAAFRNELLTRASALLPTPPDDAPQASHMAWQADRRDLAVDALATLLADGKINVNHASQILSGLPHADLLAIESRRPHSDISNLAHIRVMMAKVKAGQGDSNSALS
ncbi:hypothetical protein BH11PSE7_BH11PSE7_27830 [soil metagenome]